MINAQKTFADGQEQQPHTVLLTTEYERFPSREIEIGQSQKNGSFFSQNLRAVSSTTPESFSALRSKIFFSGGSETFSASTLETSGLKVGGFSSDGPEMSFSQSAKSFSKGNSGSSFQASVSFSSQEEKSFHLQNSRNFPTEKHSTLSSFPKTKAERLQTHETLFSTKSISNIIDSQKNPGNISCVKEENISIAPWIQENLILMDVFNERSELETPKEILFHAVKSCPTMEEFIIEKKKDPKSGEM